MRKRVITVLLAVCLALSICTPALGAMSLSNFNRIRTYTGEFSDVSQSAWYFSGVRSVYERGLMDGKGSGKFDPAGSLTVAETVKIAASLHKGYHTGSMDFEPGSPWYSPYLDYAVSNGIPVGAYRHMNAAATRADFALIIAGALPDEALTPINRIADGSIPDVFESYSYGQAVYKLYRAGVFTGSDSDGTYFPGRSLTRAEAASIIMRLVDANTRVSLSLAEQLTAEQIYKQASPAVFFVEVLDDKGEVIKTGSGFFISEAGLAITNYHVVIGGTAMKITTDGGDVFDVAGIYDYNRANDAALIKVNGKGFPYLELADSSRLLTGATVYALGSPLGLQASFSKGIVSQANREVEGMNFIQLDAAISTGSSGGALLDSTGRVVGVTSATMLDSQNINLAIPINTFKSLSSDRYVPLDSILIPVSYYEGFFPAPDFGAFFNVKVFSRDSARFGTTFSYLVSDLQVSPNKAVDEYLHLLEQNFFSESGIITSNGIDFRLFYNYTNEVRLSFGIEELSGRECFTVVLV